VQHAERIHRRGKREATPAREDESRGIKIETGRKGQETERFNCNKSTVSIILDGEV